MAATRSRKVSLPDRFPEGTRYIVEGGADRRGRFRVTMRRIVFPDGREMDLSGTDLSVSAGRRPRAVACAAPSSRLGR
jgi:hypothetical protein